MATSDDLRQIFAAGRPLIEEWLDIGEQIAALRDVAASKGLDWSQLKALMKAQVQDERDETGNGKRVARIVEKAEFASAYADMLGLANMNENNFSGDDYADAKGIDRDARRKQRTSESMDDAKALSAEAAALGLIDPESHAETARIADAIARKYGAGVIDPETGEITDTQEQPKVEAHDAEACDTHSNAVDPASIKADGRANMEPDDVDRSAERASSAVEVGAPVSPDGAAVSASSGRPEGRKRLQVAREPINAAEPDVLAATREGLSMERGIDQGVTAGETAPIPQSAEVPPAADKPETAATPLPAVSGNVPEGIPAFLLKERKPLRTNCLDPDNCACYGSHTCHACTRAASAVEAA